MKNRRSFIVGIKSIRLLSKEISFLRKYKPWGVILFSRNIKNIQQTIKLTTSIRKIFNDNNYPILIDQEGGRINRLDNIISFDNLTIELCKKYNANAIIRGLRAVSDFEYEFQLAGMNKKLNSKIETMFLMSDVENQIISSKFVKEIAILGGNIDRFVTRYTVKMLKNKFL